MGMYTRFQLSVNLRPDTPSEVIDVLEYMLNRFNNVLGEPSVPVHPLFETERWHFMLVGDSAYHGGCSVRGLRRDDWDRSPWELTVYCSLKNYDHEIEKFLDWIEPYITGSGFIGYMQCEEYDDPMLIYRVNGKIEYMEAGNIYDSVVEKQRIKNERRDKK